eukprot:m.4372 g.4372  ORF g.4372 m.4372 type:complete len:391 (+) comp3872_c0_seq1:27-1199(+)
MVKVAIDNEWYELTKWAPYHPGGERILQRFDGFNATEHFYSLHSKEAINKLKSMHPAESKEPIPQEHKLDKAFRDFRLQLEKDGWWDRQYLWEFGLIGTVFALMVSGTVLAYTHPLAAIFFLAIGMQQAGWLGHDFVHGRNCNLHNNLLMFVAGWFIGFDRNWWSEKHNTHHVLTNHVAHDADIHNQPLLFLWSPVRALDHQFRKYQHFYFPLLYSMLYISWRMESIKWALKHHDYSMLLFSLLPGYVWLAMLPWYVSLGAVMLGGFFVAIVVTLSHEAEVVLTEEERMPCYVENQFECTRNIECPDWITEYFYGGMQYQLEHHLFPTLPRYKHRFLQPLVKKFAKTHHLEYKTDSLWNMLCDHYTHLKKMGAATPRDCNLEKDPYTLCN